MIKEDYVSPEVAKLLQEKGFDIKTETCYRKGYDGIKTTNLYKPNEVIFAPTLQLAMKWLREECNIAIVTDWEHLWYAYVVKMTAEPVEPVEFKSEDVKYEVAIEEAIKYALENLIQ